MTITITKAVQRIAWRLKEKHWKANENDVEAYNAIVNFVKEQQQKQFENHELFAKLYIFVYMRFIAKMGATVMNVEPRKAVHKILQKPIEHWIEDFKNEMNDSEMYAILEQVGIDMKHPSMISEEERTQNTEKAKQISKEITEDIWQYETVKDCLTAEVNNAINLYRK